MVYIGVGGGVTGIDHCWGINLPDKDGCKGCLGRKRAMRHNSKSVGSMCAQDHSEMVDCGRNQNLWHKSESVAESRFVAEIGSVAEIRFPGGGRIFVVLLPRGGVEFDDPFLVQCGRDLHPNRR